MKTQLEASDDFIVFSVFLFYQFKFGLLPFYTIRSSKTSNYFFMGEARRLILHVMKNSWRLIFSLNRFVESFFFFIFIFLNKRHAGLHNCQTSFSPLSCLFSAPTRGTKKYKQRKKKMKKSIFYFSNDSGYLYAIEGIDERHL